MGETPLDWHVAVYCANEAPRLNTCLQSLSTALADRRGLITVILNGSRDDSLAIARRATRECSSIEIYRIAWGDKANAINQFNHHLRRPARAYAGVDGYARIAPAAFRAMEARFEADAHVVAVTGVAANGRSMLRLRTEALRNGGILHGQLHAFRATFLDRMVSRGIRLPIGLYRGDGLLGSMAAHDLEPLSRPWDSARIVADERAEFELPVLSGLRPGEVRRLFHRRVRQMQGQLENRAISAIIYRSGYEGLPDHVKDLVQDYLAVEAAPPVSSIDRMFRRLALDAIARAPRPASEQLTAIPVNGLPRRG